MAKLNQNNLIFHYFSQVYWATITTFVAMLYIVDWLFMDTSQFEFDPFYASWAKKNDPKYDKFVVG